MLRTRGKPDGEKGVYTPKSQRGKKPDYQNSDDKPERNERGDAQPRRGNRGRGSRGRGRGGSYRGKRGGDSNVTPNDSPKA